VTIPAAWIPDPAELVRDAVSAVPGVVRLHGGLLGEVATYLPGRKVAGVRIGPRIVDVHVVVVEGADLRAVAAAVHRAATAVVGLPAHVWIDDLAPAPDPAPVTVPRLENL
jgi:uncharacterized RDD family membrane protein YckC